MHGSRAEIGCVVCLGLALLAWGGLPELLSKLSLDAEGAGPKPLVFVALIVAVSAAALVWNALASFKLRRLEDRPTSRVRSLAAGPVELAGRADAATLVAPVSGEACVYWDYAIWRDDGDDGMELVVAHDSAAWPIPLRDDTASLWIDARGAELVTLHEARFEVATGSRRNPRLARFLELHRVDGERKTRVHERRIAAGDPLFVRGVCGRRDEAVRARARMEQLVDQHRGMLDRERADPSIVAEVARGCAGRAEQRRVFEGELERLLADDHEGASGAPAGAERLAALRAEARTLADAALRQRYGRLARWFLAACERSGDPGALALAAHVDGPLPAPDQALLVRGEPARPLVLRSAAEQDLLRGARRLHRRALRHAGLIGLVGLALGTAIDGARFALAAFGLGCVAIPFAGAVGFGLRTRWGRPIRRLHAGTEPKAG